MKTTMESCQSAAISITTEQRQREDGMPSIFQTKAYRATVNCPILKYKGQEPQSGEQSTSLSGAVESLGNLMGTIACNKCPISRMDLRQSSKYLADAALQKSTIDELVKRGDLPEDWLR